MKHFKQIVSVMLTLLVIFSCCSSALAVAAEVQPEEKQYPIVYVTGFGTTNLYYADDPEKKSLFYPIDTDRILGNLGNVGDYIMTSIINLEPDLLYTVLYEFLMDSCGMLSMGDDGKSPVDGVTVDPLTLNYEESGGGKYAFHYDFRLNPYDILPRLREHIAMVKEATGAEKVELVASSYGATVAMTYLDEYKDDLDDIDSVLFCVPTLGGIDFLSEIFCDELYVDPLAVQDFVSGTIGAEGFGIYLSILDKAGLLDIIVQALLVPVLREAVLDALVAFARDCVATIPAAWTCVRDKNFDKALATMFGEDYADENHKNAVLVEGVQKFRKNIMLRQTEIIDQTIANYSDMHVAVISKYGSAPIPIGSDGDKMNDGLVTLESSSFGAT
ncbi:MAG: alpha/beta hydrolase [Clostridia bacterium]|nr:alpha/beta hydrolase [Clostridia bacterium]